MYDNRTQLNVKDKPVINMSNLLGYRTSPWHCICVTTGRTSVCRSRAPITRAWPLTVAWWRRFGFLTCSSSTPSALLSTTPPPITSCWGFTLTATSSTASGKHMDTSLNSAKEDSSQTRDPDMCLFIKIPFKIKILVIHHWNRKHWRRYIFTCCKNKEKHHVRIIFYKNIKHKKIK